MSPKETVFMNEFTFSWSPLHTLVSAQYLMSDYHSILELFIPHELLLPQALHCFIHSIIQPATWNCRPIYVFRRIFLMKSEIRVAQCKRSEELEWQEENQSQVAVQQVTELRENVILIEFLIHDQCISSTPVYCAYSHHLFFGILMMVKYYKILMVKL